MRTRPPSLLSQFVWFVLAAALLATAIFTYPYAALVIAVVIGLIVFATRRRTQERIGWKKIPSPVFPPSIPTVEGSLIREPLEAQPIAFEDIEPDGPPVRKQVAEDDPGPKLWVPGNFLEGK